MLAWSANDALPWLGLLGGVVALLSYLAGRADARRLHASRVFVVVTSQLSTSGDGGVICTIHNGGTGPVFDVWLTVHEFGRRRWSPFSGAQWTGEPVRGGSRLYPSILHDGRVNSDELPPPSGPWPAQIPSPPVVLTFRDCNGRRWTRWPDGRLTRRRR